MRRRGNLFGEIISFSNLLAAAKEAVRGKRLRPEPAAFHYDLEFNLMRLQEELASKKYRPGAYRTFTIRDPKSRLISAAPYRDRVVHHAICRVIEPIFDRAFVFDSYANRVEKGTHKALDRCTVFCRKTKYVLKCDVEKFFPSIDHEILLEIVARKIKCTDTLALLRVIVESSNPQEAIHRYFPGDDLFTPYVRRRGIPIGNLTSQLFGNIALHPMDHFIKEVKSRKLYVRYADDFLIFGDDKADLRALLEEIREFLFPYRLALHAHKCVVIRVKDGIPFLGWRVYPDHRRLRRATGVRIQRNLQRLARAYRNGEVGPDRVKATIASVVGHLEHGDTWSLRGKMFWNIRFIKPSPSSVKGA